MFFTVHALSRKTVWANVRMQICKLLGSDRCVQYLKKPFVSLLKDEKLSVKAELLKVLHPLLGRFVCADEDKRQAAFAGAEIRPMNATLHL